MSSLMVDLAERSYPIHISANLLRDPEAFRAHIKGNKVIIITNQVVDILFGAVVTDTLSEFQVEKIVLPDGEQYKTLKSFESVIARLLELRAARDTTLIALGGGVIGDLTGFVAACYQRGIPFIQVPTTLLSQVDSSVGGKTAVNHPLGKNMIGAFYQPNAVIIDTLSLSSLPKREFAAGMAEVIKYGIIYDKDFFDWLEANQQGIADKQQSLLQQMIRRCCEIKAEIVAQDERESGIRALLNLGHTFGHAIEAEMGYGQWLHGEAVSAGIVLASLVAQHKNWMPASDVCRIRALLAAFGLPTAPPKGMGYQAFMQHMQLDKKVQANKIRFVIPNDIGTAVVTDQVDEALLRKLLDAS
ncbi:3-dehydroquinate synthase [Aliiglaciecola sp. CAU 1673]|uniref:3-dehydroquinate synthase n=1 Tax=Aliiglaciecola sp. CAU 1673 TaxID=3032595 RepID=UPI0023DA4AAB|nr:3-dehydroquinate synthase [Aliiglaciecola sp. CAU 1673]MDF2178676.1 3-dehydroquinate synthase [Aliiglaciecola sp. CAU 1673]